jgi:hypothetical protein
MKKILIIVLGVILINSPSFSQEEGCISGDCLNGKGVIVYSAGEKYEGEFKNGKRHGKGVYTWTQGEMKGSRYEGEYFEGQRHGKGKLVLSTGKTYTGEFKNGKYDGKGIIIWTDGDLKGCKYDGDFKEDERTGDGTFYYADGRKYVGQFKDGKFEGEGTMFNNKKITNCGIWQDGKFIEKKKIKKPKKK